MVLCSSSRVIGSAVVAVCLGDWLQLDLGTVMVVQAVQTQGGFDHSVCVAVCALHSILCCCCHLCFLSYLCNLCSAVPAFFVFSATSPVPDAAVDCVCGICRICLLSCELTVGAQGGQMQTIGLRPSRCLMCHTNAD